MKLPFKMQTLKSLMLCPSALKCNGSGRGVFCLIECVILLNRYLPQWYKNNRRSIISNYLTTDGGRKFCFYYINSLTKALSNFNLILYIRLSVEVLNYMHVCIYISLNILHQQSRS